MQATFSVIRNAAGEALPVATGRAGGVLEFIDGHRSWLDDQLRTRGAALLRGFGIDSAQGFEAAARAVEPALKNEYMGTSPRDTKGTPYVYSASELPPYYPIPNHNEMSFLSDPPRRLMFACLVAARRGGETPLADMRAVAAGLDAGVRERFTRGGIRIIRNYNGPAGGGKFDLWQLKRWDQVFNTTDRAVVEAKCAAEKLYTDVRWLPGDKLRLVSEHDAFRTHPEDGSQVWFNHVQVFHLSSAPSELGRVYRKTKELRTLAWWRLAQAMVAVRQRMIAADDQAMHCTYRDGREIPVEDLEAVRDEIWKRMIATPWQSGDMVVIDNFSVSHGRLPYHGPREVVVAWA